MIRIVYLGRKWYGKEIDSIKDDEENLMEFTEQGNPVIIVDELESLREMDIEPSEVRMVLEEGD